MEDYMAADVAAFEKETGAKLAKYNFLWTVRHRNKVVDKWAKANKE